MTEANQIAAVTLFIGILAWLLTLSYHVGASLQRLLTLEQHRSELLPMLEKIWCELRRLAEQSDRMAGIHEAEFERRKNP